MSKNNNQTIDETISGQSTSNDKTIMDQPVPKEKLPYVKPELHLLDLDDTEGKRIPFGVEITTSTATGPS